MKSQIELYDVKLNKNNALAYVRDVEDEQVIEPVYLKKDFGEKLETKLRDLRTESSLSFGNYFKRTNGLLEGVITTDDDGYGHVDWSTVNVDEMSPVSTIDALYKSPEFVKADLKKSSVYGDFATGNVRESKANDKAILVLAQVDDFAGITTMADGRDALEENAVLPVADDTLDLHFQSCNAVIDAVAKREFGEDFNYNDDFNQILGSYSVDGDGIVEFGDNGIVGVREIDGSIIDAVNDIKNFSADNDMSVHDFFQKRSAGTPESVDFNDAFDKYLIDNATDREVTPHYISNVYFEKKFPVMSDVREIQQFVTGIENMVVDDDSVKKYASEMKKVGIGTNLKSPYEVFDVLREKEPKEVEENSKKFFDDIDMDF